MNTITALSLIALCALTTNVTDQKVQSPVASQHIASTETVAMATQPVTFEFEGTTYSGLLDTPSTGEADGLVLLVHGSGRTNVAGGETYKTLRKLLNSFNLASFTYDKAGNGNSGGEYNSEQTVENSAEEALAAIAELREQSVPGSDRIGLWGISRAGWINPLIIAEEQQIDFWISVSGAGPLSNMAYLLESNWELRGYEPERINMLLSEWKRGFEIQRLGGSFDDYQAATVHLSDDPLMLAVRGQYTKERFLRYQTFLADNPPVIDAESGLMVFVEGFDQALQAINIPVLAVFGEKDTQVDWPKSRDLYQETIGKNGELTVVTLPDCNHFMRICEDCGFGDDLKKVDRNDTGDVCPRFLSVNIKFPKESGLQEKMNASRAR